jgi:hypothetical protein
MGGDTLKRSGNARFYLNLEWPRDINNTLLRGVFPAPIGYGSFSRSLVVCKGSSHLVPQHHPNEISGEAEAAPDLVVIRLYSMIRLLIPYGRDSLGTLSTISLNV